MSFYVASATIASDVASAGTFTVGYPTGTDAGNFEHTIGHKLYVAGHQKLYNYPADFTLSFDATEITVTYNGSTTIPAGSSVSLQLDEMGADDDADFTETTLQGVLRMQTAVLDLGAPDTADADAIIKAATSTELPDTETVTYTPDTDGTTPTDGAASVAVVNGVNYWELDVPRNVTVNTTHSSSIVAMTVTVTGLDEYLNDIEEDITVAATGTDEDDAGLKAFKYVRSIAFTAAADAEANTSNVGFGDVLGLPVRLPETGYVLAELEDGVAASAGTVVDADDAEATATTGDVRGTYDPNSAANGSKAFKLICALPSLTDKGVAQFAG